MSLFTNARRQFSTYVGAGTVLNSTSLPLLLISLGCADQTRLLEHFLSHHAK